MELSRVTNWVCPGLGGVASLEYRTFSVKIKQVPGKQRQVGRPTNIHYLLLRWRRML